MAFLLTHRPDAAQLVAWLSDPQHLDRLLAGTPYAVMIDPAASPQRADVLASLNMVEQRRSSLVDRPNADTPASVRQPAKGLRQGMPARATSLVLRVTSVRPCT